MTIDSGMPSRTVPSTIASAGSAPAGRQSGPCVANHPTRDQEVADEEDRAARDQPEHAQVSSPTRAGGVLDEVEGHGADQHAGAEAHDQADRAHADVKLSAISAPMSERRRCERPQANASADQPPVGTLTSAWPAASTRRGRSREPRGGGSW